LAGEFWCEGEGCTVTFLLVGEELAGGKIIAPFSIRQFIKACPRLAAVPKPSYVHQGPLWLKKLKSSMCTLNAES